MLVKDYFYHSNSKFANLSIHIRVNPKDGNPIYTASFMPFYDIMKVMVSSLHTVKNKIVEN